MAPLRALLSTLLAAFAVAVAAPAAAQEPVTVLALESTGDTGDIGATVYAALKAQIEFHGEYTLNDVPPQTLNDMLLAVGCTELTNACAILLADVTGTDKLAWGSVVVSPQLAQVQMSLYDLQRGRMVRQRTHTVPAERASMLAESAAVLARSLLYDDVSSLSVTTVPEGAAVSIGNDDRGASPTVARNIAPGIYEVRATLRGYRPETTWVVVDIAAATVEVTLRAEEVARDRGRSDRGGAAVAAVPPADADADAADGSASAATAGDASSGDGPAAADLSAEPGRAGDGGGARSVVPWLVLGGGAALLAAGGGVGVASQGTQSQFDDVVAERELDRDRATSLADTGERQARAANVLVVSGGALVAGAIVWIAVGRSGEDQITAAPASVGGRPGMVLGARF